MPKNFYITTTLPYVNAEAHLGHAIEFVRADIIARYHKLLGENVFFNTGTDEHGIKIYHKARENKQTPQDFVDFFAGKFRELLKQLGLSDDVNFVRTTDKNHIESAQAFWKACEKNGYIYKKAYQVKYCVGCELEKTDSELVSGKCPEHLNLTIENIDEENYFFKFSEFQAPLLAFYEKNPDFVIPQSRQKEIKAFVERGLRDFSISRVKEKMPWGIEVPGDPNQVMYVWFDALVNYISVIGWPNDLTKFNKWHVENGGMVQYCGKDNLRQQSAMWQAMLLAAELPNSKQIVIDGFVTGAGGVKMSKSLGNVVSPVELLQEYGTDALRYYVAREVHPFEDTPFTKESFKEAYNANLANGLGNLVSRVMKMAETNLSNPVDVPKDFSDAEYDKFLAEYNIQKAADLIWRKIAEVDAKIQTSQPFKLVKVDKEKGVEIISELVKDLFAVAYLLKPIMPSTAETILTLIRENRTPASPLFVRKD
jgi:methionyl-tRNA synthetase